MTDRVRIIPGSRLTSRQQVSLPRAVCERLALASGDQVRFVLTDRLVILERESGTAPDPFFAFADWAMTEDDAAYAGL
jgi:bifunctional DNA-binding transcriptional regulator/antitoxin component of YhaV-PrlF toxin-antitoxin module